MKINFRIFDRQSLNGYFFALLSAVFGALYYIFFKRLVTELDQETFITGLFFVSVVLNIFYFPFEKKEYYLNKTTFKVAVLFAFITVIGQYSVGKSLVYLSSSVSSVIVRVQILLVLFFGWLFLKESMNGSISLAAVIVLLGIGTVNSAGGHLTFFSNSNFAGILWALFAAVVFGTMHLISRLIALKVNTLSLNFFRIFFALIFLCFVPGIFNKLYSLNLTQWMYISFAAFFGPNLSRLMQFYSVKYIPASRSIVITSLMPVFTLFFAWIIISDIPDNIEMLGGLIILVGIMVPAVHKIIISQKK